MSRVLGIGSWDRSGSSILARILGSSAGVISVGEINNLWSRGVTANLRCGCGRSFADCVFWSETMSRAFSDQRGAELLGHAVSFASGASNQRLLKMVLTRGSDQGFDQYVEALERLYPAILAASGDSLVVDSSKIPWHLAAASRAAHVFQLVHLVRDPRGVVYSHKKVVSYEPGDEAMTMTQHGAGFTTAGWIYRNLVISGLWRSPERRKIVSYEQFSATPREVIEEILKFAGQPASELPFLDRSTISLPTEHSVSGNPVRFRNGDVVIDVDSEWQDGLEKSTRFAVGAATAPMRIQYQRRAARSLAETP